MNKYEAKKLWKYIKDLGLVSKFVWDPIVNVYDCKCKACDSSWLGNPDIGYVRKFEDDPDITRHFYYKGRDYVRVRDYENHLLSFYNKDEWDAEVKRLGGEYKSFDELWELPAREDTWENVNKSNDEQGHWWRDIKNPYILIDDDTFEKYELTGEGMEKVITPGWHQGVPKDSMHCPVCEDIFKIICNSDYNPLNPLQKLKVFLHNKR